MLESSVCVCVFFVLFCFGREDDASNYVGEKWEPAHVLPHASRQALCYFDPDAEFPAAESSDSAGCNVKQLSDFLPRCRLRFRLHGLGTLELRPSEREVG